MRIAGRMPWSFPAIFIQAPLQLIMHAIRLLREPKKLLQSVGTLVSLPTLLVAVPRIPVCFITSSPVRRPIAAGGGARKVMLRQLRLDSNSSPRFLLFSLALDPHDA